MTALAAPFPYFGGKRRAAPIIWRALGDPSGYVEPFAGSAAVLLARPPFQGAAGGAAAGIGDPWGPGPWRVVDGRLRKLPHLGDAGQGVNRELPHLGDAGRGALDVYMAALADRLHRVRITCGDWRRVVTPSASRAGTGGDGSRAILLDPPYATSGDLYAESSTTVAAEVRAWCAEAVTDQRVILCGYDDEHDDLTVHGWRRIDGKAGGGAGYSVRSDNGRREGLWLSPACLSSDEQMNLFGAAS